MKKNDKYYDVVKTLDDSKFQELLYKRGKKTDSPENIRTMSENLISMFNTPADMKTKNQSEKIATFGYRIYDYAWTEEVAKEFYNHPYHKKLSKKLEKSKDWGWWVLQCEPALLKEDVE